MDFLSDSPISVRATIPEICVECRSNRTFQSFGMCVSTECPVYSVQLTRSMKYSTYYTFSVGGPDLT